jgi:hypothetical protein
MGEESQIISLFPNLATDKDFKVTSKYDVQYNCIAWAFQYYQDRWMQFDTRPRLDGVWYWWPPGVTVSPHINAYIEAFESIGFKKCNNGNLENGFVKIVLYVDHNNDCTHAARQRRSGLWTSKLGRGNDIQHGNPYVIEGNFYGKVHTFMKAPRKGEKERIESVK